MFVSNREVCKILSKSLNYINKKFMKPKRLVFVLVGFKI